jgi:hypothetical protein
MDIELQQHKILEDINHQAFLLQLLKINKIYSNQFVLIKNSKIIEFFSKQKDASADEYIAYGKEFFSVHKAPLHIEII